MLQPMLTSFFKINIFTIFNISMIVLVLLRFLQLVLYLTILPT